MNTLGLITSTDSPIICSPSARPNIYDGTKLTAVDHEGEYNTD